MCVRACVRACVRTCVCVACLFSMCVFSFLLFFVCLFVVTVLVFLAVVISLYITLCAFLLSSKHQLTNLTCCSVLFFPQRLSDVNSSVISTSPIQRPRTLLLFFAFLFLIRYLAAAVPKTHRADVENKLALAAWKSVPELSRRLRESRAVILRYLPTTVHPQAPPCILQAKGISDPH